MSVSKQMYPAPRELLQSGRPYPHFLRFLAENGYYGARDVDALVAQRVESCGIRPAKASKTARRTADITAFAADRQRQAAQSR